MNAAAGKESRDGLPPSGPFHARSGMMSGMRFSMADLLLGVSFLAMVFATVVGRQSRWAFLPIVAAIVCGVALAGRLRKRNWW